MSRDAKIGLVIVFAFVFLFGTILVHRLHSTTPEMAGAEDEPIADDGGSPTGDDPADNSRFADPRPTGTVTVDAVTDASDDPSNRAGMNLNLSPDSGYTPQPRVNLQSRNVEPPKELPLSSPSRSGRIVVADPDDSRAIPTRIEPSRANSGRTRLPDFGEQEDPPAMPGEVASSSGTPLQIPDEPEDTERSLPFDNTAESVGETTERPATPSRTVTEVRREPIRVQRGVGQPRDSFAQDQEPDDWQESGSLIRQTAVGAQDPDAEPSSVPQVPGRAGKPQPDIQSVPDDEPPPQVARERTPAPPPDSDPPTTAKSAMPPARPDFTADDLGSARAPAQPAGSNTPGDVPAASQPYVIRDGDSFWSISARAYGTGKYFRELEELNADRLSPAGNDGAGKHVLRPGTTIMLPDIATLRARKARSTPSNSGAANQSKSNSPRVPARTDRPPPPANIDSPRGSRTYLVQEHDTLSTISRDQLGTSKRWKEILQLNNLASDRDLRPGMELLLPPGAAPERLADRPATRR